MFSCLCDCQTYARRSGRSLRSEEHTSELQSRLHLVCRLLLEKKKKNVGSWRRVSKLQSEALRENDVIVRMIVWSRAEQVASTSSCTLARHVSGVTVMRRLRL